MRPPIVLAMLASITACERDIHDAPPPEPIEFEAAPTIADAPGDAPLAKVLRLETNVATRVRINVTDTDSHAFTLEPDGTRQRHEHAVLGLKPNRDYELRVTVFGADGGSERYEDVVTATTPALGDGFPPISVLTSEPAAMEPGYTLFPTVPLDTIEGPPEDWPPWYLVIVDAHGDVVWYTRGLFQDVRQLSNGNLLGLESTGRLVELNLLGEIVRSWHPAGGRFEAPADSIAVDARDFHHDAFPMPDSDSILVPTREDRVVENFPTDESDPSQRATVTVEDEPIIEFDRTDGTILSTWRFLDVLKPTRIGYDATAGLPEFTDWAHTNAVIHNPRDDSIIASLRSQDAVVKLSRATGELLWILGPHANWQGFERHLLWPVGSPFQWQYHQHAPEITPQGTLLLFDNGNYRASPFTGEDVLPASANWSGAVEYAIDEDAMTVLQVWEWGLPQSGEQLYAPFVGDADHLPETENVLISFGGTCNAGGEPVEAISECEVSVRLIEVAGNDDDRVVFDLKIEDPTHSGRGWMTYRSERIRSLYR